MKSTNIKHVTKHKYKDLDEFLGEVTSYIEHGDINYKNIVNLEKINKIDVSDIYINNATIPISKHRRKQLKARLIEVLGDKLC